MSIKKHIPNFITCCNLLCGCLAIVKAFDGDLVWAAYLVGMSAIFDFFDGFAARMLKVSSAIGKDLDSLADMVSFGLVPGIVMFKMIIIARGLSESPELENPDTGGVMLGGITYLPAFLAFAIPIFSAIRLAKFNNDVRQTDSFIGLPTPANAIFCCSLPLIIDKTVNNNSFFVGLICNPYILCIISLLLSLLLVSELQLFALKFKNFSWTDNKLRFVFLGLSLLLLITLQYVGIPLIIIMYILLSLGRNMLVVRKREGL